MPTIFIFLFVGVQSHPTGRGDFERLLIYTVRSMIGTIWGGIEHRYGFKKRTTQYATYTYVPTTYTLSSYARLSYNISQNTHEIG